MSVETRATPRCPDAVIEAPVNSEDMPGDEVIALGFKELANHQESAGLLYQLCNAAETEVLMAGQSAIPSQPGR